MSDSLVESAELRLSPTNADLPAWKNTISGVAALLLAILFFASGAWKLTDPFQWAHALTEFKVPSAFALPFTLALGIGETLSAVLVLVPRFRRWGSWLIALMLVATCSMWAPTTARWQERTAVAFPWSSAPLVQRSSWAMR
jgi:uncharacterized membrane protein YphA (DoxX/SURF4 family)